MTHVRLFLVALFLVCYPPNLTGQENSDLAFSIKNYDSGRLFVWTGDPFQRGVERQKQLSSNESFADAQTVIICDRKFTDEDLKIFQNHKNLRNFVLLSDKISERGLLVLETCEQLTHLRIDCCKVHYVDLNKHLWMSRLKTLMISMDPAEYADSSGNVNVQLLKSGLDLVRIERPEAYAPQVTAPLLEGTVEPPAEKTSGQSDAP